MRILVSSPRLTGARERAIAQLCPDAATIDYQPGLQECPDLSAYAAVVLDGPLADRNGRLLPWVHGGGSLLAIGGEAGLGPAPARPSEWIVKVAPGQLHTARLPPELTVWDCVQPIPPECGEGEVLAWVNLGYRDRAVVVTRRLGRGRSTTSNLGFDDAALAHPDLALLLRRCLFGDHGRLSRGQARTVGLGIVGYGPYGGMGQRHGLAAAATEGLELVAACDSDPSRRKASEEDFPGLTAYATVEELAADEDVHAVIVATPPVSHAMLAGALLDAGKHVVVEKPMCLTAAEADGLVARAADNDLSLTVHQNRRWDPDYRAVKGAVEAGWLGDLFAMETFVGGFEHPCRAWHSEESVSGGAIYDWGSHHLDWALQLMGGAPSSVSAHGHKRVWHDVTNADQVRVHLSWADGREAIFVQSEVAGIRKPKFYLQGTAGTLVGHYRLLTTERIEPDRGYVRETAHHAEAPAELSLARYEPGLGLIETRLPPLPELGFPFHRNLADHLLLGEPLAVTPESARSVIAVLEAATRSAAAHGEPVQLRGA